MIILFWSEMGNVQRDLCYIVSIIFPTSIHIQKMEVKVNLFDLSLDQIIRKLRAYKTDPNLLSLTLLVKRKQPKNNKKQGEPHNVDNLLEERKSVRNTEGSKKEVGEGEGYGIGERKQSGFSDFGKQNTEIMDFVSDKRLSKAKKNYVHGNYDMAISLLNELLQQVKLDLCKTADDVQGDKQRRIANITFHLGNCYYRKKSYEKAIEYYSLQTPEQNYKHKAMRKSNLGAIYLHLNKNQESLRNYTQALKIYSQCGCEDMDLSNTYHNVGNIYLRERMFQIASKYFQMAIQERKGKSPEAELSLFYSVFKLGISQKSELKYQQSIKTLFYALSLAERGVGSILQVHKQIALCYQLLQKYNESLTYYQKICDHHSSTEEDKGFAYERAAIIYLNSKQYNESCRIMKIAEQCYTKIGNERKVEELKQMWKKNSVHLEQ